MSTASLPTRIGGDLAVSARETSFGFVRPVYTGEAVSCRWATVGVAERADRFEVTAAVERESEAGGTW